MDATVSGVTAPSTVIGVFGKSERRRGNLASTFDTALCPAKPGRTRIMRMASTMSAKGRRMLTSVSGLTASPACRPNMRARFRPQRTSGCSACRYTSLTPLDAANPICTERLRTIRCASRGSDVMVENLATSAHERAKFDTNSPSMMSM